MPRCPVDDLLKEFKIMKLLSLIWIIGLLCLKMEATVAGKFVLQNEMSEHCRRRVIPSVFLGRQVADSSAEVMHFSRLDMPYSCSISVRTESGSNIILVILSKSGGSISSACLQGHDQLLVYELGETFGGYWGALPQAIFQQETQNQSTYYTLKTRETTLKTIDTRSTDYETFTHTEEIVSVTTPKDTENNYVLMEVPLVNVSGKIELGETEGTHSDENELFDLIYDVTPKNGVHYETSMMPLLQFSIWNPKGIAHGFQKTGRRYQLDYDVQQFTPDYRLILQTINRRRKILKRPYYSTRRFKFKKKNKGLFAANKWTSRFHERPKYSTELIRTTTAPHNKEPMEFTYKNYTASWQLIESYLKLLNGNNFTTSLENLDDEALILLKKISNMKHNASVYLQPNLSKYKNFQSSSITDKNLKNKNVNHNFITAKFLSTLPFRNIIPHLITNSTFSSIITSAMTSANVNIKISTDAMTSTSKIYPLEITTAASLSSVIKHEERLQIQTTPIPVLYSQTGHAQAITDKRRKSQSGSLVDHESWENIVQVAPVMAYFLNGTMASVKESPKNVTTNDIKDILSARPRNKTARKKRYIQALAVDKLRPQQLTTQEFASKPEQKKNIFDSQNLAELVELQDDEIQGRVALHYFNQYVGPTIFNICEFHEGKVRQVFLFNSSRIVIAINNFTMDRITIVMTESRVARAMGCPPAHLECQVSGVRVCVHNMNACDGLPNCGAYDIYDEDRLLCGSSVGFHYTVCLAACTLLVVLLTLLYSVHYWLKRCIPKVSQAFFTYTDKSENILYLDTVMRSPNDYDGGSRLVYHSSFFEDDVLSNESIKDHDKGIINIISKCLRFFICKKSKRQSKDKVYQDLPSNVSEPKRKFSFAEEELRKIGTVLTKNVSIQTGDSLEMAFMKDVKKDIRKDSSVILNEQLSEKYSISDIRKMINLDQSEKELNTLRRIRAMSSSLQYSPNSIKKVEHPIEEEVELRSTVYDQERRRHRLGSKKFNVQSETVDQRRTAKHLRFEERATTIEASAIQLNRDVRYGIPVHTDTPSNINKEVVEVVKKAGHSSGRDFRYFWGKGKKKKKTKLSLR